ncbi:hypothetical protein GJ496_003038 [Pomphorhynchus laevis]|nr:hypothetical protein GJ496_003038 [Pomphorhynchus laevis]
MLSQLEATFTVAYSSAIFLSGSHFFRNCSKDFLQVELSHTPYFLRHSLQTSHKRVRILRRVKSLTHYSGIATLLPCLHRGSQFPNFQTAMGYLEFYT